MILAGKCCSRLGGAIWVAAFAVLCVGVACSIERSMIALNRASALYAQGKYEAALQGYQAAIDLDPMSSGAHFGKANSLLRLGKAKLALASYQRATELAPTRAEFWLQYGVSAIRAEEYRRALDALARSRTLRPDDAWPDLYAAIARARLERTPEAISACRGAWERCPKCLDVEPSALAACDAPK